MNLFEQFRDLQMRISSFCFSTMLPFRTFSTEYFINFSGVRLCNQSFSSLNWEMFSLFRQWVNGWLESQASFLEQQWSGLARVKQASIRGRRQGRRVPNRGLHSHDCMTTVQLTVKGHRLDSTPPQLQPHSSFLSQPPRQKVNKWEHQREENGLEHQHRARKLGRSRHKLGEKTGHLISLVLKGCGPVMWFSHAHT